MKKTLIMLVVASFSVQLSGQKVLQLYNTFLRQQGAQKVQTSNAILKHAYEEQYIDTLIQFRGSTMTELQAFATHYAAAESYLNEEHYDEARKAALLALKHSAPSIPPNMLADCHFSLSTTEMRLGKAISAAEHAQICYELDEKSQNKERISSSLNNLAAIYVTIGHAIEARDFINRAIEVEQTLGRNDILATRYGLASEIYMKLGKTDDALRLAREAYKLNVKTGNRGKAAVRLSQMAEPMISAGNLDQARDSLLIAVPILLNNGNNYSLSVCYRQLGDIEKGKGDATKATEYYLRALALCKLLGNKQVERSVRHGLWNTLKNSQPTEALKHLEAYTELTDSIFSERGSQDLALFKAQYDTKQLKKENEVQKREKKILIATGSTLLLLLLLLIVIMWRTMKILRQDAAMIREIQKDSESSEHNMAEMSAADLEFMNNITDKIYEQMRQGTPDVEQLAASMCMTSSTLRRRIRAITGQTTIGLIQQTRINYAKRLLRGNSKLNIGQIAQKCGFDDAAHFSRVFKAATGQSPTQYIRSQEV